MSHECPAAGCSRTVPDHMLMCRTDWYRVPPALRDDVWHAWRNGAGAGSADHRAAMVAAIQAVNESKGKP